MKNHLTERVSNIVCAAVGIAIGLIAIYITTKFKQFTNVPVGPEVFPRIMATGLVICSIALIVQAALKGKKWEKAPTLSLRDRGIRRMLVAAVLIVAFYLLWEPVGFLILAPVTLFLLMLNMDFKRYGQMAILSLAISVAVWLLFWQVLVIELPLGPLEVIYSLA